VSHVGGKVGRKVALTVEVADRIVQLLRAGNYVETAVAAAGIGRATFYEWLERGVPEGSAQADAPFRAFRERVDRAKAEGEARNVALIVKAAATNWHAAAWMLERQYPDRWGRPGTQRTGGGGAPQVGDGRPHDRNEDDSEGGTVTPLDALRRRATVSR
jgi:transposase